MPKDNYNRGGGNDSRSSSSTGYRGNAQSSRGASSDNSDRPYKNTGDKPYSPRSGSGRSYTPKSGDKPYQSRNRDDKPYQSRNNDGKPYQSRSNDGKPYQSRSNDGKPYQSRNNDGKPYQSRNNDSKPYQSRNNDSKPYQSRSRDDKPYQSRNNDSKPYQSRNNDGKPYQSRNNDSKPYQSRNNDSKPYQSRNNDSKPYQSRNRDDKPYQSRNNGDKPYQSRNRGDKPYQSRNNDGKPYQSRNRDDKPYQSRNRDDRPQRSFERPEAEQPVTGYEQYERIFGRNAVREAIKSGRNINKLYVAKGETDHTLSFIVKLALEAGINVQYTDRRKLDSLTLNANHQGVLAVASPIEFVSVEDLLAVAAERGEKPFLVMLDGVTDPHNAGAIIRSAYAAGAHGIIISKRRSALISEGIFKSSAGSIEHMKIAQVANLPQTMAMLQEKHNVFSVCCDMKGKDYRQIDFDMPLLLVLGSEGDGLSRLISERCDITASIPMKGDLESLNVSVAAGIIMFAVLNSRG